MSENPDTLLRRRPPEHEAIYKRGIVAGLEMARGIIESQVNQEDAIRNLDAAIQVQRTLQADQFSAGRNK